MGDCRRASLGSGSQEVGEAGDDDDGGLLTHGCQRSREDAHVATSDDLAGLHQWVGPAGRLVDVVPDVGVPQEGEHTRLGHGLERDDLGEPGGNRRPASPRKKILKFMQLLFFDLKSKHRVPCSWKQLLPTSLRVGLKLYRGSKLKQIGI